MFYPTGVSCLTVYKQTKQEEVSVTRIAGSLLVVSVAPTWQVVVHDGEVNGLNCGFTLFLLSPLSAKGENYTVYYKSSHLLHRHVVGRKGVGRVGGWWGG